MERLNYLQWVERNFPSRSQLYTQTSARHNRGEYAIGFVATTATAVVINIWLTDL